VLNDVMSSVVIPATALVLSAAICAVVILENMLIFCQPGLAALY
jgi:hypothetical protein